MAAGLSDRVLTVRDILNTPLIPAAAQCGLPGARNLGKTHDADGENAPDSACSMPSNGGCAPKSRRTGAFAAPRINLQLRIEHRLEVVGRDVIEELGKDRNYYDPRFTVVNTNQDHLAVVPHSYSAEIWIWDILAHDLVGEFAHHYIGFETSPVTWLEWSPNGTQLMSTGLDGTLRLWGIP